MTPGAWVRRVQDGTFEVATLDGAIALAVLDLLRIHITAEPPRPGPWDDAPGGGQVARQILSGIFAPKSAEAADLLAGKTAGAMGFLASSRLRWLEQVWARSSSPPAVTPLDREAAGMTAVLQEHGIPIPNSVLERFKGPEGDDLETHSPLDEPDDASDGAETENADGPLIDCRCATPGLFTLTGREIGGEWVYETRPETAAPMTIRQMVREVVAAQQGEPISNAEIRQRVQQHYALGLTGRQIDQAIAGLSADEELDRVGWGLHVATDKLDNRPYPTDPRRTRARP